MPRGARVIDGQGKYVIPGLFEMHAHTSKTRSSALGLYIANGVTTVRDPRTGDLFAKVSVETPINLTSEQRELLDKFDKSISEGGDKHSPKTGGWVDTVKRFFERISQ